MKKVRTQAQPSRPKTTIDPRLPTDQTVGAVSTTGVERLRRLVAELPGVEESSHFGVPDFRVAGKIFANASLSHPRVVVKLPRLVQEAMVQNQGDVFAEAPGWGRHGWTSIEMDKIDAEVLKDLLDLSWRQVAPKALVAAHQARSKTLDD